MDRKLNYLFSFFLIVLFILASGPDRHWRIIIGLMLSLLFSFLAFVSFNLTLDGMISTTIIGTYIFGMAGIAGAVVVLLFFLSSAFITRNRPLVDNINNPRRNVLQVWANGFWLVVSLIFLTIYHNNLFLIGAMAAVATATADTWATELKSRKEGETYLISTFKTVAYGTDGGVSVKGTLAALVGSVMIGALAALLLPLNFGAFICISAAGFLGCFIDSYVGATFQRQNAVVTFPVLETAFSIDNNMVNVVSTGAGALLAVIFKVILA